MNEKSNSHEGGSTMHRATEAATRIDVAYDQLLTGSIQLWQSSQFDGSPVSEELLARLNACLDDLDGINGEVKAHLSTLFVD
jgi:hypothetical protein